MVEAGRIRDIVDGGGVIDGQYKLCVAQIVLGGHRVETISGEQVAALRPVKIYALLVLFVDGDRKADREAVDVVTQQLHLSAKIHQARNSAACELIGGRGRRVGVHGDFELVATLDDPQGMRTIGID